MIMNRISSSLFAVLFGLAFSVLPATAQRGRPSGPPAGGRPAGVGAPTVRPSSTNMPPTAHGSRPTDPGAQSAHGNRPTNPGAQSAHGSRPTDPGAQSAHGNRPTDPGAQSPLTANNAEGKTPDDSWRDEGWRNYGQYNAAHKVAENLGIDYELLKEKMLGTGTGINGEAAEPMSLGEAVQALKPDADLSSIPELEGSEPPQVEGSNPPEGEGSNPPEVEEPPDPPAPTTQQ